MSSLQGLTLSERPILRADPRAQQSIVEMRDEGYSAMSGCMRYCVSSSMGHHACTVMSPATLSVLVWPVVYHCHFFGMSATFLHSTLAEDKVFSPLGCLHDAPQY